MCCWDDGADAVSSRLWPAMTTRRGRTSSTPIRRLSTAPRDAVPAPISSKDSTGKYKTLPGFARNVGETSEEVAVTFAQGRLYESKKIFTALRLMRMDLRKEHPDIATAAIERIKQWMVDNEKLIDEAMRG